MSHTHTYALLAVSKRTYDEVAQALKDAGYDHAFDEDGNIDMHGIALCEDNTVGGAEHGQQTPDA